MGWDDYNFNNNENAGIPADFNDELTRKSFTKKVLGILGLQLTITFGLTLAASAAHWG